MTPAPINTGQVLTTWEMLVSGEVLTIGVLATGEVLATWEVVIVVPERDMFCKLKHPGMGFLSSRASCLKFWL
jgi:proteasome assembly chaperone (PAC2) family protein